MSVPSFSDKVSIDEFDMVPTHGIYIDDTTKTSILNCEAQLITSATAISVCCHLSWPEGWAYITSYSSPNIVGE